MDSSGAHHASKTCDVGYHINAPESTIIPNLILHYRDRGRCQRRWYVLTQLISVSNFRNQTPDAQTRMSSDCMCVYLHQIRGH